MGRFLVSRDSWCGSVLFSPTNGLLWASTPHERHMSFDILGFFFCWCARNKNKIKKVVKKNKQTNKKPWHSDSHACQTMDTHLVREIGLNVTFQKYLHIIMSYIHEPWMKHLVFNQQCSLTYPTIIFDVDISTLVKEILHYIKTISFFSCHMQGSHLMERKTWQK